jgi:hypothetical protein
MSKFSWKKLADTLAQSDYLDATDDLTTQRGVIAASVAILNRMLMSERLNDVSWTPERLRDKSASTYRAPPSPAPATDDGLKVFGAVPSPVLPPTPAFAEVTF